MLKALFYWWNINITLPAWCYSDISKREDASTATQRQQSKQPRPTLTFRVEGQNGQAYLQRNHI